MVHSSRNSYRDKASMTATYKRALETALTAVTSLEQELRLREEREIELLVAVDSLIGTTKALSGNLYGTVGDFGVGALIDRRMDETLSQCRPAIVILRASAVMNQASLRLQEVHTEHDDAEEVGAELLKQLELLSVTAAASVERRQKLLITGVGHNQVDEKKMHELDSDYVYDKAGVTLDEAFDAVDVEGGDSSDGGNSVATGAGPEVKIRAKIKKAKKRHSRRHGFFS